MSIKVGDAFTLKNGEGPVLTVVALSKENDTRACCGWFDKTHQYHSEWFHTDALRGKNHDKSNRQTGRE